MNKYFILLLGIFTFAIFLVPSAHAAWLLDRTGALVQVDGMVLGDDEQNQEMEQEERENEIEYEDENGDNQVEQQLQTQERLREKEKQKLEQQIKLREKTKETLKQKTKSKIEIENGHLKIKQETESENGKIVTESEIEFEDDEELNIEQKDGEVLEVKTITDDELKLTRKSFHAKTSLPITIGDNNELIITRPDGTEKIVTILPDQAAEKMRARGLVITEENTELVEENGTPVYKFEGTEERKVLGLFRFATRKQVKISAETGEVVSVDSQETNFFRILLDRLSI